MRHFNSIIHRCELKDDTHVIKYVYCVGPKDDNNVTKDESDIPKNDNIQIKYLFGSVEKKYISTWTGNTSSSIRCVYCPVGDGDTIGHRQFLTEILTQPGKRIIRLSTSGNSGTGNSLHNKSISSTRARQTWLCKNCRCCVVDVKFVPMEIFNFILTPGLGERVFLTGCSFVHSWIDTNFSNNR